MIGNANLAMLAATAFALYVLWRQRKPSRAELSKIVETSLMSGGVIILITSGGGAFGAMLKAAQIDIAIKDIFAGGGGGELGGVSVLLLGFFIGKPNPLIMREAMKRLGCTPEDTLIVGDRMDTDIIAGIESEIETALVLSGITTRQDMEMFPYKPDHILDSVADIIEQ